MKKTITKVQMALSLNGKLKTLLLGVLLFAGINLSRAQLLVPFSGSNTLTCGTNTVLEDHAGSGIYANNANGFTVLNAGVSATININGTYDTELNYDYVRIYDGSGTGGALLASFTGVGSINYTGAPGQTLTVQFVSDISITNSGFNLNVTYSGGCSNGAALNFDGTNDVVNCGTAITSSLNGSAGLTAEAWIRPSALPAVANIVSNHNLGGTSFALRSAGTQLNAFVGFGTYTINTAVGTLSTNVWQHVAMVFNGTSIRTFINGVATGSVSFPSYILPVSTNSVVIGNNSYNEAFNGNIDEVRIWNRALCQGEIQNNMMGQLSLPQTSLVAYYQFNQGGASGVNPTTTLVTAIAGPTGTLTGPFALNGATSNWVAPGGVSSSSTVANFAPITLSSGTINVGQSFTVTPSISGTYTFNPAGPVVTPSISTTYTATGTTSAGCFVASALSTVSVNAEALNFDGVNDAVVLPSAISTSLAGSNALTIEAWIRPTNLTGVREIYSNHSPTASQYAFNLQSNSLQFFITPGGIYSANTAANTVTLNVWQHVAAVFTGNRCLIYINGSLSASSSTFATYAITSPAVQTPSIGADGFNQYFAGNMDEVRIWNRALCQGEIQNNMMGQLAVPQSSLMAYYRFNQGFFGLANPTSSLATALAGPTGTLTNFALTGTTSNWVAPGAVSSNSTVANFVTPTLAITSPTAICLGSTTTLTASGVSSYTWTSGPTTATFAVSPTVTTTYSVIGTAGTATNGCLTNLTTSTINVNAIPTVAVNNGTICSGSTFTIVPSGANTYTIQGGSAAVSPTANASYTVIGTSTAGCVSANTATSNVTVNAAPSISVNSGAICAGNSFTMTPSGASTYTFSGGSVVVSPTATSAYTVTGTNTLGCNGSAVSNVTVNALPTVSAASSNTTFICVGSSATLTASGASSYVWNTTATTAVIAVSPTTTTSYTVTGTGANGCSANAVISQSVSTCTGIDNLSFNISNLSFQVYPNPSTGIFNIDIQTSTSLSLTIIEVTDVLGRVILTDKVNAGNYQLNLGNNVNGVYFVKATVDGKTKTVKIIRE